MNLGEKKYNFNVKKKIQNVEEFFPSTHLLQMNLRRISGHN